MEKNFNSSIPSTPPPLPPTWSSAHDSGEATVNYFSLRFLREEYFQKKLAEQIEAARAAGSKLELKIQEKEEQFFQFLSQAVDIDDIGGLPEVIRRVRENLGAAMPIHVFLTTFPEPHAMCVPRLSIAHENSVDALIVLVSQHFMNNLNDDERAFILGHELAHALLGHSNVPKEAILESEADRKKLPELVGNLLRWSICCEISCDLVGYVASGRNIQTCQNALLKIVTGLNRETYQALGPENVVRQVLNQHSEIAKSVVESVISTHPLTPLRLKILNELNGVELFEKFGSNLSPSSIMSLRSALSARLDPLVRDIYPDFYDEKGKDRGYIAFYLGVASSLADGKMDRAEAEMVATLVETGVDTSDFFAGLESAIETQGEQRVIHELVDRAINEAKGGGLTKAGVKAILRDILAIAAVDGRVDANELHTIFRFAKEFGYSKQEIVYLANQAKNAA